MLLSWTGSAPKERQCKDRQRQHKLEAREALEAYARGVNAVRVYRPLMVGVCSHLERRRSAGI